MNVLEQALALYDLGWCVVPVHHGTKAPTVPWRSLQTARTTREETRSWFAGADVGMGVICGQVSGGLAVLDFDVEQAYGHWAANRPDLATSLPTLRTGRGFHVLFRLAERTDSTIFRVIGEKERAGDLLAESKHCVLPPTVHGETKKPRVWVTKPKAELPVLTLAEMGVEVHRDQPPTSRALSPVGPVTVGGRHSYLLSVAGRLRNEGMGEVALRNCLETINAERCEPPLPIDEVHGIAHWAATADVHSLKDYYREDLRPGPAVVPHDIVTKGNEPGDDDVRYGGMFLNLADYLTLTPAAEVEWLVEGFLPTGYLVIVGGTSKAGKSCLLTNMALKVADGQDFLGLPTTQGPVLWVALEETESERRLAIEAYDGQPDDLWTTHEKVYIDSAEGIKALRYWVRRTGAKLLIIDPLYGAHRAEGLSDGTTARRVLQPLKDLCREERVTAVVVHHLNKATGSGMTRERMADSNQILAAASMDILLDATEMGDGSREIVLHCRGRGDFANQNWVLKSSQMGEYILLRNGRDVDKGSEATDAMLLEALALIGSGTAETLAQQTGIALGTVRNRLTALRRGGSVTTVGKEDRSNVYQSAA